MTVSRRIPPGRDPIARKKAGVRRSFMEQFCGVCICIAMASGTSAWGQIVRSSGAEEVQIEVMSEHTFGEDVEFLRRHVDTIVLGSKSGAARVAVVPAYQGRVMTSSATGLGGTSFGWINYAHIESGKVSPQINVSGGEERFWLGPEGGQFSIFFKPGVKFDFAEWSTPSVIDTEPFAVIGEDDHQVSFRKEASLRNYSQTNFQLRIDRSVELLSSTAAAQSLGCHLDQLDFVGYRSSNRITNIGDAAWSRKTGLLSIWLLGMYKPGPRTTVVIPYQQGPVAELGPVVNDAYFGKVPPDRLRIDDGVIFFSGDGAYRAKIGVSPQRATNICGSYDDQRGVLTIVKYDKPEGVTDYVNSMWELQDAPYAGDAVNAYNDGPPEAGAKPLGPFYELETSSPALALKPGETGLHAQETYHFQGEAAVLDRLSQLLLGVSLERIKAAFATD